MTYAPRRIGLPLVLMLMVLAPVGAEYLVGYDTSTGHPLELLGGLLILAPLYGAPAVLVRETARRTQMRWPGILALALAAAILQAGVFDQSLFSESYRDIDYWSGLVDPTWLPWLGLGAYPALNFLTGHVIWSFGAPIALTEAAAGRYAQALWLRRAGLAVVGVLYLGAAALILSEHLRTEDDHAAPAQIAGSLVLVLLLAGFAFTRGRRAAARDDRPVPRPRWLLALGVIVGAILDLVPSNWAGFAAGVAVLSAASIAVARFARSRRWTGRHVVALCTGAFAGRAAIGVLVTPLGDVAAVAKYAHNAFFLLASIILGWWLARRAQRRDEPARGPYGSPP